jgi:hypothetical protein
MTKLTDTQLVLLSAASQRLDGVIPINERLKGGVATTVGERLIALGLAEQRFAMPQMNSWRETAEGQCVVLVITPLGLAAVGIEAGGAVAPQLGVSVAGRTLAARWALRWMV